MGLADIINDNGMNRIRFAADVASVESNAYSGKRVEITVRQTVELTSANHRAPEIMAVKTLANAFDQGNVNYKIWYNFPAWDAPNEFAGCDGGSLQQFREEIINNPGEKTAKDANFFMTNATGGGCGGGNAGKVNAGEITEVRPLKRLAPNSDGLHQSLYATLHEVGHQLGAAHSPNDGDNSRVWGEGYWGTFDGKEAYIKTPNVGGGGFENACGKYIEQDDADPSTLRVLRNEWSDCAASHFVIR